MGDSPAPLPECEPLFEAAEEIGFHRCVPCRFPRCRPHGAPRNRGQYVAGRWSAYRRCHLRDFQAGSNLFHASMLEHVGHGRGARRARSRLTGAETEVLTWSAAGKSYWEIATILGYPSARAFFMTNARRKLNVRVQHASRSARCFDML